jgi:UDP-glucuronate decarboxylase
LFGEIVRILVTGAAGFLGSHFAERYLEAGHEILAVDNFFTGERNNISHLFDNSRFELLRHDITQPLIVEVDAIANFACPASPVQYQKFPVQTTKTSVIGMTNMLGLAKRLNIKIMQASTSEVYGDPNVSPQPESYWGNVNPVGPRSCYDEGKRVAETLMFDYSRQYKVPIKIARIFNTYGPRMSLDDGRVVTNFIGQALRNKPITVYGDGMQTRSFCYVDDLVLGLSSLFDSDESITGPLNLGNPVEITMLKLASLIIKLTNSSSSIEFRVLPENDPKQRCPDISYAKQMLDWEPKVGLEDGLLRTIKHLSREIQGA